MQKNYNSVSHEINTFLKQYSNVDIKSKKIRDSGTKFTTVSFNFELDIDCTNLINTHNSYFIIIKGY